MDFFSAIECGDIYEIEAFLKDNPQDVINAIDCGGNSSLHCAVQTSNMKLEVVKLLLKHGADVNAKNSKDGMSSPLLYAVQNPKLKLEVIETLLENGARVNKKNNTNGKCALHYAVQDPNIKVDLIRLLLNHGLNVHTLNFKNGFCALFYAVTNPHINLEVIEVLLSYGVDINLINRRDDHKTPLIYALQNTYVNLELIEFLLKQEADVFARSLSNGLSVMHYAVQNPNARMEVIELLLDHGANVDIHCTTNNNCTPLHCAVQNSTINPKIVELLINRGAQIISDYSKYNNYNALHYAVTNENIQIKVLEVLIKYGCDINGKCFAEGGLFTPLHLAVKNGNVRLEVIKFLLQHGADINAKDNKEGYPINVELIRSDPDRFDSTPLHYAAINPNINPEVIELLLECGANFHCTNRRGETPLNSAVNNYFYTTVNVDVLQILLYHKDAEKYYYPALENKLYTFLGNGGKRGTNCIKLLLKTILVYESKKCIGSFEYFSKDWCIAITNIQSWDYFSHLKDGDIYLRNCINEIMLMGKDYITEFDTFYEFAFCLDKNITQTQVNVDKVIRIFSNGIYPIYMDRVLYRIERKLILEKLSQVQVYTKSGFPERNVILLSDAALIVAKYLPKIDVWCLVQAFHEPTEESKREMMNYLQRRDKQMREHLDHNMPIFKKRKT